MTSARKKSQLKQQSKNGASVINAKAAFRNFSLSRRASSGSTRTYLDKTKTTSTQQRSVIKRQLQDLPSSGPGMTIVMPNATASTMLKNGKMELATLITAMDKAKRGTQFYTAGTSLNDRIDNENRVEAFFAALKEGNNAK